MRLLELIARGYELTNALFHLRGLRRRRVFSDWEIGSLLEGLAHGPRPAVAGLDDGLRALKTSNLRARDEAYKRSRLVADRIRQGDCRAQGRLQPAQTD